MPPYDFHRPDSPLDRSDSEDDLNLQELDPATSNTPDEYFDASKRARSSGKRNTAGIALRNLRSGARSRFWNDGRGASGAYDDDAQELLQDDLEHGQRSSQGSVGNDDAPLLSGKRAGRRRMLGDSDKFSGISSKLRLPSFNKPPQTSLPQDPESPTSDQNEEASSQASRQVLVGRRQRSRFAANVISNAKYTPWSFLPRTLYNEFSFFFNMYFLLVALSQVIPILRIGYMSTYIAPLAFVISITLGKEAFDDIARRRRDAEANSEGYTVISYSSNLADQPGRRSAQTNASANAQLGLMCHEVVKKSRDLKVGDVLKLRKDQRLPADVILLKSTAIDATLTEDSQTHEGPDSGESFIRTDQLDGETDWKLRLPSPLTQSLKIDDFRFLRVTAGAPDKKVNEFVGTIDLLPAESSAYDPHLAKNSPEDHRDSEDASVSVNSAPLNIDNTAWANTVLASNTITYAAVVYTGSQTRSAMSTSPSRSKTGLLEYEINNLTKILCALTLTLSIILVALEGFEPTNNKEWYVAIMIYLILFSTIIPMSLRVNVDMAKSVYAMFIQRDKGIPDTVVRTSTIPEDLGRIEYLLSDKTGTLTQNEMELKKIHVGTVSYANEAMDEVSSYIRQGFAQSAGSSSLITPSTTLAMQANAGAGTRTRREIGSRVRDVILALALCHNVTPTSEEDNDGNKITTYQASSPDEIAIVKYTENVGLRVVHRDRQTIALESVDTGRIVVKVRILDIFPFTSESKRMGIIVQFQSALGAGESLNDSSEIWFYQKGADTVMTSIVAANDWLDEETANMAREGLRTLVVGRKRLSAATYGMFSANYKQASLSLQNRDAGMSAVIEEYLERDLDLLGVTGVEDKLQQDVKPSLELLRNAGVKIWMLTGDKVETARCVAVSSKLVARGQYIHTITKLQSKSVAQDNLDFLRNKTDACLLIDGESLAMMLTNFRTAFISLAVLLPAVVACRCSPTQKADVATLIRQHTSKRICCIGDGGNDVSMIQAADVGIGIVGKEGRQASLAADFSITHFHHLTKLLVWHGRNSYKRSAKLAQFIIHRGLIISVCQTMYSIASQFDPKGLFIDWLMVGYATVYTMAPVFSLVFDRDVDEDLANLYPELYKELKTGKSLSYRSFAGWLLISVYQGCVIQGLSQILVDVTGPRMLSVSFTVLVLNELIMVAVSITTWHPVMIVCILGTAALYAASVPFLGGYFDLSYIITVGWVWRVCAVAAISLVPVWGGKVIRGWWKPPSYRKVQGL